MKENNNNHKLSVLMITCEWPTKNNPNAVPFLIRQIEFLRKAGVSVDVFSFRGNKKLINYIRANFDLKKKIRQNSYDLIHAQWGQSASIAFPKKLPLVITFRGDDLNGIYKKNNHLTFKGWVLVHLSKFFAGQADEVIVVSKKLGELLPIKNYHILPSGLDLDLFRLTEKKEARKELGLNLYDEIVLFVGNTKNPSKRFDLLKQAVEIAQQTRNFNFLICENIDHEKIPIYMNASNLLVLPSAQEGSPNVIKEALACNLPVLATAVGDVEERIKTIPTCEIILNLEPHLLAKQINQLLQKNQGYEEKNESFDSRTTILDLDEKIITKKIINIYQSILKNNASSSL